MTSEATGRADLAEAAGGVRVAVVEVEVGRRPGLPVEVRLVEVRTGLEDLDPAGALQGRPDEMGPEFVAALRRALDALHDYQRAAAHPLRRPGLASLPEFGLDLEGLDFHTEAVADALRVWRSLPEAAVYGAELGEGQRPELLGVPAWETVLEEALRARCIDPDEVPPRWFEVAEEAAAEVAAKLAQ